MNTDYKFEEEEAWRMSRELAWDIYSVTNRGGFDQDHRLRNSVRRASFAIMANVAEGIERGGSIDFGRYLSKAKNEIHELHLQLEKAQSIGYINSATLARLEMSINALGSAISGLMTSVNQEFIHVNSIGANYQIG